MRTLTAASRSPITPRSIPASFLALTAPIHLTAPTVLIPPTGVNGDFNYDGLVDYRDYAIIDTAFGMQGGGPLADSEIAAHTAEFGAPYLAALASLQSEVPEPAALGLLAMGSVALLRRRK